MDTIQTYDLGGLSLAELRALDERAAARLRQLQLEARDDARRQIAAVTHELGMSLEELFGQEGGKGRAGRHRYVNPSNPNQEWSGLGRKPGWINAWLGQGKSLEELRR